MNQFILLILMCTAGYVALSRGDAHNQAGMRVGAPESLVRQLEDRRKLLEDYRVIPDSRVAKVSPD